MKVSVIIPVYNVKPYLERCVNSVLRQTYKDIEIILVDDGSTDGSGELCDHLATGESNLIVVHQPNQGVSEARNTGIRQARGEYLAFIDSDDEWLLTDGLENILQMSGPDAIIFKRVDIWKNGVQITSADYAIDYIEQLPDTLSVFSYLVAEQQFQISACFMLVRRKLILDHEIFFPKDMMSEDLFWSLQLWQHLTAVKFTNLNLYGYHHRENSRTTTANINFYHSYDQMFTYWKTQCDSGCKNAGMIRAFMANMWVNRGYAYHSLADVYKPEALRILEKHVDSLEYGLSPKSKRTRRMIRLIGLRNTATALGWYWKLRGYIKH